MPEILDNPLKIPAAWTAEDMRRSTRWVRKLSGSEIAELDAALAHANATGRDVLKLTRDDFPLPTLSGVLDEIRHELEEGCGAALIRGLPVDRWGDDNAMKVYWGMSLHLGEVTAQNGLGQLLGHVRAAGRDWEKETGARGYQTNSFLPYHCDKADIVGLLCLQTAKRGGESCIASSVAIYNAVLERRPDLVETLYSDLWVDLRDEQPEGIPPYYLQPMYRYYKGRLFGRFGRKYIESGQRFNELPRLTAKQVEAMNYVEELAHTDEFRLDMTFAQGDIQYLNNHTVMHSRKDYEDFPEPERWRHLVRILLFSNTYADVPDFVHHINKVTRLWGQKAGTIGSYQD